MCKLFSILTLFFALPFVGGISRAEETGPLQKGAQSAVTTGGVAALKSSGDPVAGARSGKKETTPKSPDDVHRSYLQALKAEKRFPTAASCGQCHPDHFEEWSVSPHAYAMLSPVFNSMHAFLVQRTSGTTGDFCIRCHTPPGMDQEHDIFGSVLLRPTPVVEAITCVVCHRIDKDYGNISGRMPLKRGPINEPVYGPSDGAGLKKTLANPKFGLVSREDQRGKLVHKKAIRSEVISRSAQCAMCHDVNSPAGIRLESAFTEYKNSPAVQEGITCQDCHMNKTPGTVLPQKERFSADGRDLNFAFGPVAKVRNSPDDPREGITTTPRKKTNHMFIGPDYSIVHPGLFPHSVNALQFTYGNRFQKVMTKEAEDLANYVKNLSPEATKEKQKQRETSALRRATKEAERHLRSDWITFRWREGWGTPEFEEELSQEARMQALEGVGFPWNQKDDPVGSQARRETARLILARQFNLLNKAHVERIRILRRALQLGKFEIVRNDDRGLAFTVDVCNPSSGHSVPTGFDAERVMFLKITVRDGKNRTIFQSGDRDPNGDLRDLHSSFVHARAPKEGKWLAASAWKESAGLERRRDDKQWLPDPFLFSLQSKFLSQNIVGGERETVLALDVSIDPLPFVRPPSMAAAHTGRAGPVRKKFRTIPPLSKRTASYQVERNQLTGAAPYRIEIQLISQMVPVNLIRTISPVGFDLNLSASEVAKRVAYGHRVDSAGTRKGGAVVIWDKTVQPIMPASGKKLRLAFTPNEEAILSVPVNDYPFPHTSEKELAKKREALSGSNEAANLMIKNLGPLRPDIWPGGVPDGLPMLPPIDVSVPSKPDSSTPPNSGLFPPADPGKTSKKEKQSVPEKKPILKKTQTANPVKIKETEVASDSHHKSSDGP